MLFVKTSNKTKYMLLISFVILSWSLMPSFSKIALIELDIFQLLFYTTMLGAATLFVLKTITKNKQKEKYNLNDYLVLTSMGLIGIFLFLLARFESFNQAPAGQANIITYTYPILMTVFSLFIFNSRINKKQIISLILGFVGVFFIFLETLFDFNNDFSKGYLIAFITSLLFAFYSVMGKKLKYNKLTSMTFYYLIAFIFSTSILLLYSKPTIPTNTNVIVSVLFLRIIIGGLAFYWWFKILEYDRIIKTANIIYLVPFFALIFTNIINSEPITIYAIFGLAFIVVGIILQTKTTHTEKNK